MYSFHASTGWYISPLLKHYCCISAIMEGTGSERLTDDFCFKHHAMPDLIIAPLDKIIVTTRQLTDAIAGV